MTEHLGIAHLHHAPRKSMKNDRLTLEESNINPNTTTTATLTTTAAAIITTIDGTTSNEPRAVNSREIWNASAAAYPRCTPSGLIMMYERSMLIVGLSVAKLDAETWLILLPAKAPAEAVGTTNPSAAGKRVARPHRRALTIILNRASKGRRRRRRNRRS